MKSLMCLISWGLIGTLVFSPASVSGKNSTSLEPDEIVLEVDTTEDFNDLAHQLCTPQPEDCSLRGAISHANKDLSNSFFIRINNMTYNLSLVGYDDTNMGGDLDISADIRIEGKNSSVSIINANQIDRVIHVHPAAEVVIRDLNLTNGQSTSPEGGGGVYNAGN